MDADLILFMVDVSQLPDEDDRWLAQEVARKGTKDAEIAGAEQNRSSRFHRS